MEETHDGTGPFVRPKPSSAAYVCKAKWHLDSADKSGWKHYFLRVRLHWSGLVHFSCWWGSFSHLSNKSLWVFPHGPSDMVMWYGPLDWEVCVEG